MSAGFGRPLAVAGGVLAVLLGAVWALSSTLPEEFSSPSPIAPDAAVSLVAQSVESVSAIRIAPADGLDYTLTRSPGGFALTPARLGFSYRPEELRTVAAAAVSVTGRLLTPEPPGEELLADWGLRPPAVVWSVTAGGRTVTLELGGKTPLGDGWYARVADAEPIYVIPAETGAALSRREPELRDLRFWPDLSDYAGDLGAAVRRVRVVGRETYAFRRLADDELDPLEPARFLVTEPVTHRANDYSLNERVIDALANIRPSLVIEDEPSDLKKYGLDEPYSLEVELADGVTRRLLIGGFWPGSSFPGRYVMIEGKNSVLVDEMRNYQFLNLHTPEILSKLLWIYPIEEVSTVTIELPDATRVLAFSWEGEALRVSLDGREILDTNGKRLYAALLQLTLADRAGEQPVGEPVLRVTLHFWDGRQAVMALFPVNERYLAAKIDGAPAEFTVARASVAAFLEKLRIVDNGGKIE